MKLTDLDAQFENWFYIDGPLCKTLADAVHMIDMQAKAIDPTLFAQPTPATVRLERHEVNVIGPIGRHPTVAKLVWVTVRTK